MKPFNSDSAIEELIINLTKEKDFSFDMIIETGTYYGATAKWFAETFSEKEVHTIDKDIELYGKAVKNTDGKKNLFCHFGDSREILEKILENNQTENKKILFYLDAHWHNDWPLLGELDIISKYCKNNSCVIIDDFHVPFRPHQFDKYKGQELNLEYIRAKIVSIFDEPFFFFPDQSKRVPRPVGKIICFPKTWKHSLELKQEQGYFYW